MLPRFHRSLESYHQIAKEHAKPLDEDQKKRLATVLDWTLDMETRKFSSDKDSQMAIFELQQKKNEAMQVLHQELHAIDTDQVVVEHDPQARFVRYEDGIFFFKKITNSKGIHEVSLTFSDILVDLEWDVIYTLDHSSVPKGIRKRYAFEKAKRMISSYLEEQLYLGSISDTSIPPSLAGAYVNKLADTIHDREPPGIVMEKVIFSQLKKWLQDYHLPLKIKKADLYQDVEQKIDLIVEKESWRRGVQVEVEQADINRLGLQVTLSNSKATLQHKLEQIAYTKHKMQRSGSDRPIDDLVLVQIEFNLMKLVNRWKSDGKPPGGPIQYWDKIEQKKALFYGLLEHLFEKQDLDTFWKAIVEGELHQD